MAAIWWGAVIAGLCAGGLGWRIIRYPGGRAYAFHEEYRKDREALGRARQAVRELRNSALKDRLQAQVRVKRAERTYRRRVAQIETALQQLRTPGRGARVEQLGGIVLYENVVLLANDQIPLASLQARLEYAHATKAWYVYMTEPSGHERAERYDAQEFEEDAVHKFRMRLQNAAVKASRLQAGREDKIRVLKAELRLAEEATEPVTEAAEALEETRARHESDPKLPKARAALDDARDTWQDLTGHRPF